MEKGASVRVQSGHLKEERDGGRRASDFSSIVHAHTLRLCVCVCVLLVCSKGMTPVDTPPALKQKKSLCVGVAWPPQRVTSARRENQHKSADSAAISETEVISHVGGGPQGRDPTRRQVA